MKLTNISLAILVALGLAACGGSDDNNDQTTDPKTPPKKEEPKKEVTPTTTTPPKSGLDPDRAAPDMTVPADIENIVATRKTIFVDRTFTDSALGYAPTSDFTYIPSQGTDPANVKTTSLYNFATERDVVKEDVVNIVKDTEIDPDKNLVYTKDSLGAIHVGKNPGSLTNNAFVKTPDGYVRVATKPIKGSGASADEEKSYNPETKFYAVKKGASADELDTAGKSYDQSEVFFIANAKTDNTPIGMASGTDTSPLKLGKETVSINSKNIYQYDPAKNEVSLTSVKMFDQTYTVGINGQNIDFGKLPRKAEIQNQEVTGEYQIRNGKDTGSGNDNFVVNKKIKLGNIKAYNLPYAIAFVTTNVDEKSPIDKPIFGDSFQVLGFKTIALPKEGRAKYTGKSFGPAVEGDIELIADFFADRAGVSGSVLNRKDKDGNTLPNLTLDEVSLTTPENHKTGGFGAVKGAPSYAKVWTVNFYGQEAEEAAGSIGMEFDYAANDDKKEKPIGIKGAQEVFNSQRGKLTNKSNTPDTK